MSTSTPTHARIITATYGPLAFTEIHLVFPHATSEGYYDHVVLSYDADRPSREWFVLSSTGVRANRFPECKPNLRFQARPLAGLGLFSHYGDHAADQPADKRVGRQGAADALVAWAKAQYGELLTDERTHQAEG